MSKKTILSATIITLNEEKDLQKTLESIKDLVDEIVVVDSGSSDKTVEIAKRFRAKVYERKFDNYQNQKNYAQDMAKGEWIISIDADEKLDEKLKIEIKKVIESGLFDGYSIPRKNIIFGKFIRFSRWQPELDRHIWLWKKEEGRWVGEVHEEVFVKSGKVGRLTGFKIHYQYDSISDFFDMINRYSELEAKEMVKKGKRFSLTRFIFDPIYNFLVRYFYRLGFLDCWRGFVLSYLMAIYHLSLWIKVRQLQQ